MSNRANDPIIHSVHGECLRKVSDSILVMGCPYDGPVALELNRKDTSSIYKWKKKLCLWESRRPGSEGVSQDSPRSDRTKLSNRKHTWELELSDLWPGDWCSEILPDSATSAQLFETHLVYKKIEQNEAVHTGRQWQVASNICHVNRASSNVVHPPSTL